MALKDTTKQIQKAVGTTADGIYGKNTALKIKCIYSILQYCAKGLLLLYLPSLFYSP